MDFPTDVFSIDTNDINRGIVFLAVDYTVEFSNEKFATMMGLSRSEVHGMDLSKHIQQDDWANIKLFVWQFYENHIHEYKTMLTMYRKDGTLIYAQAEYHRLLNNDEEVIYKVIVFTEMTETEYNS